MSIHFPLYFISFHLLLYFKSTSYNVTLFKLQPSLQIDYITFLNSHDLLLLLLPVFLGFPQLRNALKMGSCKRGRKTECLDLYFLSSMMELGSITEGKNVLDWTIDRRVSSPRLHVHDWQSHISVLVTLPYCLRTSYTSYIS